MYPSMSRLPSPVAFANIYLRRSMSRQWIKPRLCISTGYSTSSSVPQPISFRRPPTLAFHTPSIWKFLSDKTLRATHRSSIYRASSGGGSYGGGGPQGPWQRFRDRVNAIPGDFLFWGIIGLNGLVFVTWNLSWAKWQSTRDPSSYMWMIRHFATSLENLQAGRWYTLLTSCFSHETTSHLLFNGFTFYFMAPTVIAMLGNVGFLGLYLGGGIVSSVAGILWRKSRPPASNYYGSHGASGAIYSILSFFACVAPTTTFLLFGVVPLPAWALVTGVFIWDGYSAVNQHRVDTDTAGHIGGLLSGIGYFIAKRFRIF